MDFISFTWFNLNIINRNQYHLFVKETQPRFLRLIMLSPDLVSAECEESWPPNLTLTWVNSVWPWFNLYRVKSYVNIIGWYWYIYSCNKSYCIKYNWYWIQHFWSRLLPWLILSVMCSVCKLILSILNWCTFGQVYVFIWEGPLKAGEILLHHK